jgi:hypothetical protein
MQPSHLSIGCRQFAGRLPRSFGRPGTVKFLTAIVLVSLAFLPPPAVAQTPIEVIIGERHRRHATYCTTRSSRDALIHLWKQGLYEPLPSGCDLQTVDYIPLGVSQGTYTLRPFVAFGRSGITHGQFLVAQLLSGAGQRPSGLIYMFYPPTVFHLVQRDGRPAPELRDP